MKRNHKALSDLLKSSKQNRNIFGVISVGLLVTISTNAYKSMSTLTLFGLLLGFSVCLTLTAMFAENIEIIRAIRRE